MRGYEFCSLLAYARMCERKRKRITPLKDPPYQKSGSQSYSPQLNENKGNMMKLKVNEASQLVFEGLMELHPAERKYIEWVAKQLGCSIADLRLLESLDPNDEEGFNLKSFLPAELELQDYDWSERLIHSDVNQNKQIKELQFVGWSIGNVYELQFFGRKIIADQNASPFGVYMRNEDISYINSQL